MLYRNILATPKRLQAVAARFGFSVKDLEIRKSEDDSPVVLPETIPFGTIPTKYMLVVDFVDGVWENPVIKPFENFSLSPFNMTLHYALCCFEGMKAYKDDRGQVRMFRPELNMARFDGSIQRLGLEPISQTGLLECIEQLILLESDYIPQKEGSSLYIRPFCFALDNKISVSKSNSQRVCVILSPAGSYFGNNFKPVNLILSREYERGNPLSVAQYKLGGNYAPTVQLGNKYLSQGYDQILWVHNDKIIEVGAMNIFFLIKNDEGVIECITPPLDGSVLPGITRRSMLEIIRQENKVKVSERNITVSELTKMFDEDRVLEIFGSGTAATCVPIHKLSKIPSLF